MVKRRIAPKPTAKELPAEADQWAKQGGIDPEMQSTVSAPLPASEPSAPKRGRARGKRSDPSYVQVGAYIPRELDKQVKRKLIDSDQDFSELIADLLAKWLSD